MSKITATTANTNKSVIYSEKKANHYIIANLCKGGVIKLFQGNNDQLILNETIGADASFKILRPNNHPLGPNNGSYVTPSTADTRTGIANYTY